MVGDVIEVCINSKLCILLWGEYRIKIRLLQQNRSVFLKNATMHEYLKKYSLLNG